MTIHMPIPDFDAAREAMVDTQLRPQGVNDPRVLAAMAKLPRERFVPKAQRPIAYIDRAVAIGEGRMLPPAATVGLLLTQLAPQPGERALVIGAGSGYSAAILVDIGLETTALESDPGLAAIARKQKLRVVKGPLEAGYKKRAPYDLILIDGAVALIPEAIIAQLEDGGRLGAAVIDRGVVRLTIGRKAAGALGCYTIADAAMPRLPGFQRPRAFTF